LKNREIAISWPRFDRFRPNLARQRRSAVLSRPSLKCSSLKLKYAVISATELNYDSLKTPKRALYHLLHITLYTKLNRAATHGTKALENSSTHCFVGFSLFPIKLNYSLVHKTPLKGNLLAATKALDRGG